MANWPPKNGKNNFMDSKIPFQEYSSTTITKKCALMNEQQWAQLNEQIKQICLDCSKQFVQHENGENSSNRLASDRRTITQTSTMPNNGTVYSSAQNKQNSPHVNQRQDSSIAPQTLQLPPTSKKSSGFSLPRLLLPKGKEKQSRRPSNQQQQDLPEQHSPTTTTSAYGTGGTDTGQESPVERNQQIHEKNSTIGNAGLMPFGGGEQQKQQSRENLVVKGGRQKSVKFDTSSISFAKNATEDIVQLPGGVFYTSAERLAQTLEAQQRLLRKELQQEEIPSKIPSKSSHQLQRQQPLDKTKKHLIRVPTFKMANWPPKNGKNNFMDSKIPFQEYSSTTITKKCALMNEQQWAQLNEQIKQICLDCSKQFVQHENGENSSNRLASDRRTITQTSTMPNNGTVYSSAQNKQNSPHVNQRQDSSIAPQTLQLPPTSKKSSGFSLPRLLLPKGKEKQSRRPSNQQQQDLPEQHSPTTTTSAYGTGGTDTGQESPVERNQQIHEKNSTIGNAGLMPFGGGEQQKQQSRENLVVKGGRQKSVKFDTSSISFAKNATEDIVQLPGGVFYTSAERLAQTLEAQQRLLRKELQQEEIPSKIPSKSSHQLQRQQPLDKTKKHLIRVPPIPMPSPSHESQSPPILHFPPASSNSSNFMNRPSPMPNLRMRNPSAEELSPRPVHKTLLGRPPSLQHVVPPNSPKSTVATTFGNREEEEEQMHSANFQNNIGIQNNKTITIRGRQMHLKPTLDNIFAYKPTTTNTENEKEKGKEQQPKAAVIRQFGIAHQSRRKSKSPVKQMATSSQQQSSAELEWVIKRRPDGTRYVTRRPARKQKQCWSAVVKARREQSLLRERYQSGAVSTTTDDDGAATGNEMAHQASRLWMREQRRRHKGKTTTAFDAAMAIERSKRECLYGDEEEEDWRGGNNNNNGDFGSKQQILPRLNTDLRQLNPQQQIASGRGHSLPGQAIFSITTV